MIHGNKSCNGNTFFCFLDFLYIFLCILAFHTTARTGADYLFAKTWQQVTWQHFFSFSWTYINIFMASSLSIPLHRLELISFMAISGHK